MPNDTLTVDSLPAPLPDKTPSCSVFDDKAIIPHILPELQDLEILDIGSSHWHIKDWKQLDNKCHGPILKVGQHAWRILLYPRGNGTRDTVSIYLEALQDNIPPTWYVCAQFGLVISNPEDPTIYHASHAHHRFSTDEVDWGFTRFYDIKDLDKSNQQKKGPFLVNQQTVLSVYIRVVKDNTGVLWHNLINYDSKKETGYVGIKNQGATCYMNSLLQSLYCTNLFRKAVYQIPTVYEDPTKSVALALQRLFYQLQYATDSDTSSGGTIKQLFVGKMKSYIKCIDVDYESSRVEDFYDIQLNVMGCKDVLDSFHDYIREETMDGENKYMAEGHGLQNALKGVIFESFPPVLHLQLKRFEYNAEEDSMVKINDRYQYPEELCLDAFCTDRGQSYTYVLHSVLVHSGDFDGGHYFTLIKPSKDGKWLRFDDDHVTPVSHKEVFEDNFGDEPSRVRSTSPTLVPKSTAALDRQRLRDNSLRSIKRFTNAYMLVYIQKSKLDHILAPLSEEDIPVHLRK
ncbi:hypothetical protein [Absidia glauca]|uniref:Ubiquitin carboxyl-terminal hydrolase n=1 Tax=Absidia glauca TaxID=4829 RepID=A0A163KP19_ABSGL|nr:hypothetical protein [Absidia glauca]